MSTWHDKYDENEASTTSEPEHVGVAMHCNACLERIRNVLANGVPANPCSHNALLVNVCFSVYCVPDDVANLKANLQQHTPTQEYIEQTSRHGLIVFVVPTQLEHWSENDDVVDSDLIRLAHDVEQQQREVATGDAIHDPDFEHYLIAEALVMEATMLCYKSSTASLSLKKPSSITGASSWKFACQLMANPQAFHSNFQSPVKWMNMSDDLATILLQFHDHPEWNLNEHMKHPFKALYRWLDSGMTLLQTIRRRKGLLRNHRCDEWTVVTT
ncbi:hypothetical protein DYB32_000548 [Aphanomyces invadans]|uniref:Uncharacterized protein n=1 Tax=Aphanomyces invadans TaxID=157072 RepID=A0A3R7D788_9STRA|nr:hypothetical protein DYB32_000548 [Aphanomyces invadans]